MAAYSFTYPEDVFPELGACNGAGFGSPLIVVLPANAALSHLCVLQNPFIKLAFI